MNSNDLEASGAPSMPHEGNAAHLLREALEDEGEGQDRLLPEELGALLPRASYSVESFLGEGGMGAVYRGTQVRLRRPVAIKVMLDEVGADDGMRVRFLREAEILGLLAHPNIVPIHDLLFEDGVICYSMKLVNGRTLQAILDGLRRGRKKALEEFTLDRLLLIFRKVCDAIAFAHSKGVLHRDLKPENVMVGEFGEVLVMDWGIAKVMKETGVVVNDSVSAEPLPNDFGATLQGTVTGTPQYMSPEQAQGLIEELDERSDIFSLGGILYAILTLRPPVQGATVQEVLQQVAGARITPPSKLRHTPVPGLRSVRQPNAPDAEIVPPLPHFAGGRVPPALSSVTMKALRLEKSQRYPGVAALSADVEAYQNGFATSAQEAGTLKQLQLLVLRHKAVFTSLAALFLLSLVFVFRLIASERKAAQNATKAMASEAVAVRQTEATRRALARSQISLAEAAYREHDSQAMLAALEAVPADLRAGDWRYLHGRADTSQSQIASTTEGWFIGAAPHPKRPGVFALAAMDHTFVLVEAKTGKRLSAFPVSAGQRRTPYFRGLEFSPDGSRLAAGGLVDGGVAIYDAESGKVQAEWDAYDADIVHFSPDGICLLDVHARSELAVHEAATGQLKWRYQPCSNAVFTSSGQVIAVHGTSLRLLEGAGGAVVKELPNGRAHVRSMVLAPDDATLFMAHVDGYVRGLRLADGEVVFEERAVENPSWFRVTLGVGGSKVIAAAFQTNEVRIVRVWDTGSGRLEQTLMGSASKVEGLAVHPLSEDVIVTGPDTRTWSLATRLPKWKIPGKRQSAVFWGSDDLFIPVAHPLTLDANGRWNAVSGSLPTECSDANVAAAMGGIAAIGNSPPAGSTTAVLRKSEAGFTSLHTLQVAGTLGGLRLSPQGRRLAAFSLYFHVISEETATGERLQDCDIAELTRIWDVDWIGQDHLVGLATKGDRGQTTAEELILLWDAATGRRVSNVRGNCIVNDLAVAPDGQSFAEGGEDKRIRIRDPMTLAVQRDFRAHDGIITALAYHPSKPILASASADYTIRLWNLENGNLLEELRVPSEPQSLSFSPSGHRLSSADAKQEVSIWEFDSGL